MHEILSNRAIIKIQGTDSQTFLQGMVTNDLVALVDGGCAYTYMLNNQGRFLFDFFVYKNSAHQFRLDIDSSFADLFIKKISFYKLRNKVEISNISDNYMVIYSPGQSDTPELTADNRYPGAAEFSCFDPRYTKLGVRSLVGRDNIDYFLTRNQENLYLNDKYKFAIPDGATDLVYEKSIPIEYGGEEMNGISFKKGCYIGQEVISRAKYQGVVRKKIFQIILNSDIVSSTALRAEITDLNGNKIGYLCSSYANRAIAIIREEKYENLSEKKCVIDSYFEGKIVVPQWRS